MSATVWAARNREAAFSTEIASMTTRELFAMLTVICAARERQLDVVHRREAAVGPDVRAPPARRSCTRPAAPPPGQRPRWRYSSRCAEAKLTILARRPAACRRDRSYSTSTKSILNDPATSVEEIVWVDVSALSPRLVGGTVSSAARVGGLGDGEQLLKQTVHKSRQRKTSLLIVHRSYCGAPTL